MEDIIRRAYRGDPGVPHTDPDSYVRVWLGSFAFAFAAVSCYNNSGLSAFFSRPLDRWQDKAMMNDQHKWKKIMEKKHHGHNHNSPAMSMSKP